MKHPGLALILLAIMVAILLSFSLSILTRPAVATEATNIAWNTFAGGSGTDKGYGIAVDSSGNVYVMGYSDAAWGASPVRSYSGAHDAFVAKLDASGALLWHTFLGSSGYDYGYSIAVDGSGNVCAAGHSDDTWGSPVNAHSGVYNDDVFVAKLNSSGALVWNTFVGRATQDLVF